MTEADTCRKFVVPRLQAAGWDSPPHLINEQRTFTDGRIIFTGGKARRGRQKRADYLLRYRPDFPIAVVEAKAAYRQAGEGLQQAKEYAEILGLKFAYATNGAEIIEFDYTTGVERTVAGFPSPTSCGGACGTLRGSTTTRWPRNCSRLRCPTGHARYATTRRSPSTGPRRRCCRDAAGSCLPLCTGAGKTAVAFQVCWKLWSARWNRTGRTRRPKILFLADRNVLVDDPMAKDFRPFGDARAKISGTAVKSRDMYFAIYQAIARDEQRPGLGKRVMEVGRVVIRIAQGKGVRGAGEATHPSCACERCGPGYAGLGAIWD